MSKGVVIIAHNTDSINYLSMAAYTAKRVETFLRLPTTVITDQSSVNNSNVSVFDNVLVTDTDTTNKRKKEVWINKGRYKVFDLTPYEETIVLDSDYLINSPKLLELFEFSSDFMCHKETSWLMKPKDDDMLSKKSIPTLWATVMRFHKSKRVEQIFNVMEMIQKNYDHYANIYGFLTHPYRNDYALTISLKTVNGHLENKEDYIPWPLVHADVDLAVERITDVSYNIRNPNDVKNRHIIVSNTDFHMLNKKQFIGLIE